MRNVRNFEENTALVVASSLNSPWGPRASWGPFSESSQSITRKFKKVLGGSRRFKKVQEGPGKLEQVRES